MKNNFGGKEKMKKIISILLSATIICALSGCNVQSKKGANDNTNAQTTTQESGGTDETTADSIENTVLQLGETITFNNLEITVNSAETADKIENSQYTAFTPDEGNIYIVVNVTVKNIDKDASKFLPMLSQSKDISTKLTYNDYEFKSTNLLAYSDDLHDTYLNPLSSKTGVIVFSVAEDIADLSTLNFVLFNNKEEYVFALSAPSEENA